jgi:hypothetical protein
VLVDILVLLVGCRVKPPSSQERNLITSEDVGNVRGLEVVTNAVSGDVLIGSIIYLASGGVIGKNIARLIPLLCDV